MEKLQISNYKLQTNNPPQAEPKFKITNFGISLRFGACLFFACPPSFWRGAWNL